MKPRLLDLFCGAGGAAMGYHRAGFEVLGVDIEPQSYPFKFKQGDAFDVLRDVAKGWQNLDAIHASPPCQDNLHGLRAVNRSLGRDDRHKDFIVPTRELLEATGLPYVIENIVGSRLVEPIRLCGSSFGLDVRRHRLFECSFPVVGVPCAHHLQREARHWTSWRPNGERRLAKAVQVYGNAGDRQTWGPAMGIDWMEPQELTQAIPPAYTEHIGHYLMAEINAKVKAAQA